ncbi:cytochrome c oxidase accessory protein CcoG [Limibacter armeniacum]|uniref:cytochrome c oxidase accessory protein CcoG n=1 Tax=Limibacter armeniacum TaxID=466084 RepID=UPI002FE6579A
MVNQLHSQNPEEFRNSISTVGEDGKRIWLYPKKPKGRFYNARKWVAYLLIAFFFAGPFLKVNGEPFLMFNILERQFVILGNLFVPQDFFIFVLGMIMLIIFIVLFTVVYGRVWCGWACPQTVFMEMVFRRIEYWIEGDANQQRKLDKQPWTTDKILKKTAKHTIFLSFSFLIANMVLGYIFGGQRVLNMMTQSPLDNWGLFVAHLAFALVFYAVFAKFREQACIAVCPYGRLQGVLLDKDSIAVTYDHERGEPRGKLKKSKQQSPCSGCNTAAAVTVEPLTLSHLEKKQGDCVDCNLCVQVCPTGIDIRNGIQLECVNCTACMDACDAVMDKIGKDKGLIRYASANSIEQKQPFRFTPRIIAYTVVLALLVGAFGYLLTSRDSTETTILRVPGMIYQKAENGDIRNIYSLQVINKTNENMPITVKLVAPEGKITFAGGDELELKAQDILDGIFFVDIPAERLEGMKTEVQFEIYSGEEKLEHVETNFLGPAK